MRGMNGLGKTADLRDHSPVGGAPALANGLIGVGAYYPSDNLGCFDCLAAEIVGVKLPV